MRAIYKFQLQVIDEQKIPIQEDSKLLCVKLQDDKIVLYAEVDLESPLVDKTIAIVGTGHRTPSVYYSMTWYIGTVQMGIFVWHVYEVR